MAESIGERLLKARLGRGETLDQVSLVLHIRPRYLEALECDERSVLPSEVQGKGFLRLYAGYLGLSLQPLLDDWGGNSGNPVPQPPVEQPKPINLPVAEVADTALNQNQDDAPESEAQIIESSYDEPAEVLDSPIPFYVAPIIPLNSSEILVQIGVKLRDQREHLNLSLGDVERHTHVRQRYLAALEEGRMEALPSTVQGRGMLNNYASFLQLDSEALLLKFAEALQTRRIETVPSRADKRQPGKRKPARPAPAWRRVITPDLLIGIGLITMLVIFAIWAASRVNALQTQQEVATPPSIAEMLLQTGSPVAIASLTATQLPNVGTRIPDAASGVQAQADTATPGATITLVPGGTGPLQLAIVPSMSTYMRVTVDGKIAFDGRALPGNAYPFSGSKRIELLTGNAAALQVFFNQVDLGNLGLVGQVKTLIFSKDGVVTPTAMFTATSTKTLPPTSTPLPSATVPTATITPLIP
jgi:cytoskeleton protein RodZ